jgi:ABC-type phosphonate transport system ATPase subunit
VLEPRLVIVDHPLGGVDPDAMTSRADGARQLVRALIDGAR